MADITPFNFGIFTVRVINRDNQPWFVANDIVTTLITFGFVLGAWMWTEGPTKILSGAWHKYTQESPQTTP